MPLAGPSWQKVLRAHHRLDAWILSHVCRPDTLDVIQVSHIRTLPLYVYWCPCSLKNWTTRWLQKDKLIMQPSFYRLSLNITERLYLPSHWDSPFLFLPHINTEYILRQGSLPRRADCDINAILYCWDCFTCYVYSVHDFYRYFLSQIRITNSNTSGAALFASDSKPPYWYHGLKTFLENGPSAISPFKVSICMRTPNATSKPTYMLLHTLSIFCREF